MRAWFALGMGMALPLVTWAQVQNFDAAFDDGSRWVEVRSQLPPYPKPENYLPFKVDAVTSFDFFVDAKSVSVDNDGVVRYSLIAKSTSGVLNISFEGMRCSGRQYRVYAFGRSDNSWSRARSSRWQSLPQDASNPQRAMLYDDYFCPEGSSIATAERGLQALRKGGRPLEREPSP
ncbi:MAG: CNP1-like family protein [Pseudomonadota bacterium]